MTLRRTGRKKKETTTTSNNQSTVKSASVVTRSWALEHDFDKPFENSRDRRDFLDMLAIFERTSRERKHTKWTIERAALLRKCLNEGKPFIEGLLAEEPTCRGKIIRLTDRILKSRYN